MDIKNWIQYQIFAKNYYLARVGYFAWFYAKAFGKQPLLVYQMGKVASMTVDASLARSKLNMPIFHFHYLSSDMIMKEDKLYYDERIGIDRKMKNILPRHLFTSYFIRSSVFAKSRRKKKWKIITLVRDPVARNISDFFQHIDRRMPRFHKRIGTITYEELYQDFLEKPDHEYPLNWFDSEFYPYFGIDVYASQFPWKKGYMIYSNELAKVLLMRVENLSDVFSQAISEFLGVGNINLISKNQSKNKLYSSLYQEFLKRAALPGDYIKKMYSSKFAKHFYSEQELGQFTSRWCKGSGL